VERERFASVLPTLRFLSWEERRVFYRPPLNSRFIPLFSFAHLSSERGHGRVLAALQVKPLLDLGMRLGEGTGAVLGMDLVESAVRLLNEMATFTAAGVAEQT
jgi:NaMN:DMB phosphoribosyltransferase